jgi:microcystin-dependent protein
VHFARAGLPHHAHDLAAGGAAHDGIVHQHHALAFQQVRTGFSFSFTPKSRMACEGSMNVRPT